MQRHAMVEKVKEEDCTVTDILIGSVAVNNYMSIINHIKLTAVKSSKKYYEVLTGELNEPKLKNFNL